MADEPSNGELARLIGRLDNRFAELNSRFDKVVGVDVYAIQTAHVEQRLAGLQAEDQRLAAAVDKNEDEFERYRREQAQRREDDRQKRLYQAIIPVFLGLLSVAVSVWAVVSR